MALLKWKLACILTLSLVPGPRALGSLGEGWQSERPTPAQVRRELDAARALWKSNSIPYYRLRVSSSNPLHRSVAESDVRNGSVLAARQSNGMPGYGAAPGTNWGPFDGQTVEALFQKIEDFLDSPGNKVNDRVVPDIVRATYDARHGYPTHFSSSPGILIFDAGVSIDVELIESPPTPLIAPSPGEAYASPVTASIVNPELRYDTMFGFGSDETARILRRVWPARAAEMIMSRGVSDHWLSVGWTPRAGLAGSIIGTLTLGSGVSVYVMEFQHQGQSLYILIQQRGVAIAKSP